MLKFMTAILITGFLGGCATIPNVTLNYHPATWNTSVTVTQTVGCTADKKRLVVLNTPSVTTTYSSNLNKTFEVKIKNLAGRFNDSEINMFFTDDGRLKSINQSTTGQGETIVKSAVSVATAMAMMGFMSDEMPAGPLEECSTIEAWGASKPITLTYKATINPDNLGKPANFEAAPESNALYQRLQNKLPNLKVASSIISTGDSRASYVPPTTASDDEVLLELQKISSVGVLISANNSPIGNARIVIPENDTYNLPIPKAALFGKQTFAVVLSEAGAVTNVSYVENTGTASALNALGAIANTETTTAKITELRGQADLIVQQQRVVLCETKPDQCK